MALLNRGKDTPHLYGPSYKLLKHLLIALFLFHGFAARSQDREIITIIGFRTPYTIVDDKVYADTAENPARLVATIKGNRIYKGASAADADMLYRVDGNKVYKSAIILPQNLLFYLEEDVIYLRTKKGTFEKAGKRAKPGSGSTALLSYLEPLEYIALGLITDK